MLPKHHHLKNIFWLIDLCLCFILHISPPRLESISTIDVYFYCWNHRELLDPSKLCELRKRRIPWIAPCDEFNWSLKMKTMESIELVPRRTKQTKKCFSLWWARSIGTEKDAEKKAPEHFHFKLDTKEVEMWNSFEIHHSGTEIFNLTESQQHILYASSADDDECAFISQRCF